MSDSRLLVISNRLPLTLSNEGGSWQVKPSSGGLATAMEPILKKNGGLWIGWSGDDGSLSPSEREELFGHTSGPFSYVPVEFPPGAGQKFYEGYPNQTVWPLFHFFPSRMSFDPDSWRDYEQGNEVFASTIAEHIRPGDLVWVHDYHLMLLPRLIRSRENSAKVGFFLHIPFPSSEVFAMLPRGNETLRGLLGADLIAFHTHRHLHHFRSSLLRILGVESTMDSVEYEGRTVRLEALPIGIAPGGFSDMVEGDADTAQRIAELRTRYSGKRILISVDRLDYSKGIPERLRTYARLLREQPELREHTILIQVAVPSREGIGEYQTLGSEINQLVGEINGQFATAEWTPIVYLRHSVDRGELATLYAVADVAWVTPLRDGMNLVAKEYCASKVDHSGVLVLSQFAGAAAEMGEALLVNPYDEEQVASAVLKALSMPTEESRERMRRLRERVIRNDVFKWADRFLDTLESTGSRESTTGENIEVPAMISAFRNAGRRMLVLDYDGTLVPIVDDPAKASPSKELVAILAALAAEEKNLVAVVSGRRRADLERWLGSIPNLVLGAEHGALIRRVSPEGWHPLQPANDGLPWKARVSEILQQFADRAPGSFVEEKEFSLVWHYRRVEPEFGTWLAGELRALLDGLLSDADARPVMGHKIVEVRPPWANKGAFVSELVSSSEHCDFQLAAGDDTTDEDMWDKVEPGAFTIHVGHGHSRARYRVKGPESIVQLLMALSHGGG